MLFTLKDVAWSPKEPKANQTLAVSGKINALNVPFLPPVWVITSITFPKKLLETAAPEDRKMTIAIGGKFQTQFTGLDREGNYELTVRVYAGPTVPLGEKTGVQTFLTGGVVGKMVLPPIPPVASSTAKIAVVGMSEAPDKEQIAFTLGQPTVDSKIVMPGGKMVITCPVINASTLAQKVKVKAIVYEGGISGLAGDQLAEYLSSEATVNAGQSRNFTFEHIATMPSDQSRRDVGVEVWIGGNKAANKQFDDVFEVKKDVYAFSGLSISDFSKVGG